MNRKPNRAFTLIEMLISIMLLSLVLMALHESADILRKSNKNLFKNLQYSSTITKGADTLYKDILKSNGHISIKRDREFHRLTIENTKNSIHGLYKAKVVWLVYKEDNVLLRIEGSDFELPLKSEDGVAIDVIGKNIELFKIYRNKKKDKILVVLKDLKHESLNFLVQNIKMKKIKAKTKVTPIIGGSVSTPKKDKKKNMLN